MISIKGHRKSVGRVNQAFSLCLLWLISWFDVVVEKLDDVFRGGAGQEDFGDALFLQSWQVFLRNDAADQNKDVIHPFFTKQLNDAWAECVVRATENRDAHSVHVLL